MLVRVGAEPDLFFDGRSWADQYAARHLVHAGFITAATLGLLGQRVAAPSPPPDTKRWTATSSLPGPSAGLAARRTSA
jgi:hypothetical protein